MSDEIENVRSTARDHLANERTFLAWVRTALGIMGLGVILEKLVDTAGTTATVASIGLVAYGAIVLVYSLYRYEQVGSRLREGKFPVARRGPFLLGLLGLVVMVGAIALVLL
ncbi:MAG: putative membrane protein [Polyangiales bacterium]|jgi:putative membrane protein